ncbi:hypothetical protein FRACA_4730004 [Frankia canadensis]|uniref:Uncharacterized protein n=1 Tax=Frankia canadensis TaxID=1836972 RepID=A0A2I2KXW5_9ACTN|nr:hypothetical protein FRACA_4730004 [Frankia canadensis]SOU57794.1 hypothetical protein FRACA_4730004 [Frankia canadensis]
MEGGRRWCFFVPSRRVWAPPGGVRRPWACGFVLAAPLRLEPEPLLEPLKEPLLEGGVPAGPCPDSRPDPSDLPALHADRFPEQHPESFWWNSE